MDPRREPCDCSQWRPLVQSGYSEQQGPTHYCPVCRWAFWSIIKQPSQAQLDDLKKDNPHLTLKDVSYIKLCNKPPIEIGRTIKTTMIDQLGGLLPTFLTASLREYWLNKYCEKYPSSKLAENVKRLKKREERRLHYGNLQMS